MKKHFFGLILFTFFISLTLSIEAAEIAYIEGNVQVMPSQQKSWKRAELGMQINIGDSIRTARRSKADIILDRINKHSIRVEENTLVVLNSSYPNSINKLDLSQGKVYANIERVMAGFNFEVTTPSAIAGVRGTSYSTESSPRRDEVAVFRDTVHVQSFDAQRNLVSEMEIPEQFKVQIDRFEAAGMLTELSEREMEEGSEVRENLIERTEAGPVGTGEKKEEPGLDAELQKAEEIVDLILEKTSETQEQKEEGISDEIIEEIRGHCEG